jgi:hypothetical protein
LGLAISNLHPARHQSLHGFPGFGHQVPAMTLNFPVSSRSGPKAALHPENRGTGALSNKWQMEATIFLFIKKTIPPLTCMSRPRSLAHHPAGDKPTPVLRLIPGCHQ